VGVHLGSVLPTNAVTGASFYRDPRSPIPRLLLSLNLEDRFRIVSIGFTTSRNGVPKLLNSHPSTIITIARSSLNDEPEGLATTARQNGDYPLGGLLHWQLLPTITPSTVFSRILTYQP
jgi:hypothetical protein